MINLEGEPKPETKIETYIGADEMCYAVDDLIAVTKMRSKHLRRLFFDWHEEPFNVPLWISIADQISPKKRRKLMKRYMHEWNYYISKCTAEMIDIPDVSLMRN